MKAIPNRWTVSLTALALCAAVGSVLRPEAAQAQTWREVTTSRQLGGENNLKIDIRYGAGRFQVSPADGGVLYRMHLRYDEENFEPLAELEGEPERLAAGEFIAAGDAAGESEDFVTRHSGRAAGSDCSRL